MKIRTKLLYGYLLLFGLLVIPTGFTFYSQYVLGQNIQKLSSIASEIDETQDIALHFERLLMPANDYLISAEADEKERYKSIMENLKNKLETYNYEDHTEFKKKLSVTLKKLDSRAVEIFSISPAKIRDGVHGGSALMYAMDKEGEEATKLLNEHAELDRLRLKKLTLESDNSRQNMSRMLLGSTFLVLIIGFALVYFIDRSIRLPIEKLTVGVRGVSHGRWNQVVINDHGEITELAREFNDMVDQVSENYEELELKVEERTKMLDELNKKLKQQAITDGLTGLYNHRFFYDKLTDELSRAARYKREVVILMIDIDYFKVYNDKFGHLAGDEVLRGVAETIRDQCRKSDTVARYGGEEFAIIAPELHPEDALDFANRLRLSVVKVDFEGEKKLPGGDVTISIGLSVFPRHGEEQKGLLERADEALYEAKKRGRDRAVMYESTIKKKRAGSAKK